MNNPDKSCVAEKKKCNRSPMLLGFLFLIFLGPMAGAYFLYTNHTFVPEMINYGHLMQPPVQLHDLSLLDTKGNQFPVKELEGRWLLLLLNTQACESFCEDTLYKMRQVRLATGTNQEHIGRVIVTLLNQENPKLKKLLESQYQGTLHLYVTEQNYLQFAQNLKVKDLAIKPGRLYLVDPLGNIMMSYKQDQNPEGILQDLNRLLSIAKL